jgi:predicted peptidase
LNWGADLFLEPANRVAFPAIVLFPQCPAGFYWVRFAFANRTDSLGGFYFPSNQPPANPLQLVMELLKKIVEEGQTDDRRIYVGGLSLGGFGTYDLLWRMPHFFAAAFPICGAGNPNQLSLYAKNFPVWIFHGGSDPVVPVGNGRLMFRAMQEAGANVKYSEYPGVGHDSWKNAFAEPDLLPWLFSQTR